MGSRVFSNESGGLGGHREAGADETMSERATSRGLFIGRWLGIEFYLDYSWFLIAAIVTYQLAREVFPIAHPGHAQFVYLVMGAAGGASFLSQHHSA